MNADEALFERLIDYAGLFPPAVLTTELAIQEYSLLRGGPFAWMLGRFIVPASRLNELCETIGANDPFPLSVVLDAGVDARSWLDKAANRLEMVRRVLADSATVRIEALEVPLPNLGAARDTYDAAIGQFAMVASNAGLREMPIYVEAPRTASWIAHLPALMTLLARARFGAKIRCGGIVQSAFPASDEIAAFLATAYEYGIPFKATAGLHHAVRKRDEDTGLEMHGFLNLLATEIFVRKGLAREEVLEVLDERDASAFRLSTDEFKWRDRSAGIAEIQSARAEGFVGYGSCSFEDPVRDLLAFQMLRPASASA